MVKGPNSALMLQVGDIANAAVHREIEVQVETHGIAIRPVGYGNKLSLDGEGSSVFIEFRDGIPVVVVWDDINNEEPSHIITLRKAAESNRRDR